MAYCLLLIGQILTLSNEVSCVNQSMNKQETDLLFGALRPKETEHIVF